MRRLHEPPPRVGGNSLSFVMISHPSEGMDEEVRRQVRSHAANSWRGVSRLRTSRRVGLRPLEPKLSDQNVSRQFEALESSQTTSQAEDDDPQRDRSTNTSSFASSTIDFTQRSRSLGPSPVTYLGGGRIDHITNCEVECNTMESFLLDHCKFRSLISFFRCTLFPTVQ